MLNLKGTKFIVFALIVCVLLTYAVFVDAGFMHGHGHPHGHVSHNTHLGGHYIPRGHPYGGHHSSSTRSCPSLLLIAGLMISIASLNAARTLNSESASAL